MTKNTHQIDQQYKSFKPFDEWSSLFVDEKRWAGHRNRIEVHATSNPEILNRALRIASRAAAVQTGAVENLYSVDRGITMTIAIEAATWEQSINSIERQEIIRDQLDAYEGLLDLATGRTPIIEAGVRELHKRLCQSQDTYLVQTPAGPQKHEFRHGEYKIHSNHVLKADGTHHAYAPVDLVSPEMSRLCDELRSEAFETAHAVVQAAYTHHALTVIHPFADGNGRVARAVASVYLYRNARIPFLFFTDKKENYYDALAAADDGKYEQWIEFVTEAGLQTMLLVQESFKSAAVPPVNESLEKIRQYFKTKGGYTHNQIDKAASRMREVIQHSIKEQFASDLNNTEISAGVTATRDRLGNKMPDGYRELLSDHNVIQPEVVTKGPPAGKCIMQYHVCIPKDAAAGDSIILVTGNGSNVEFEARVEELIPDAAISLQIRIDEFAIGVVALLISGLEQTVGEAAAKL